MDSEDKYGPDFSAALDLLVSDQERPRVAATAAMPWENFTTKGLTPRILFMDRDEMRSVAGDFCRFNHCKTRPPLEKGDSTASTDSATSPPSSATLVPPKAPPSMQQQQQQPLTAAQAFGADQKSFFDTLEWADDEVEANEGRDTSGGLEPGVADLLGFVSASDTCAEADEAAAANGGADNGAEQLLNINGEETHGGGGGGVGGGGSSDLLFEFNDDSDTAGTPASAMPDDNFDPFVSAFGASGKDQAATNAAPSAASAASEWTADFSAFDPFGSTGPEAGASATTTAAPDSGFQDAPSSSEPLRPVSSSSNLFAAAAGGSGTATPTAFSSSATSSPRHSAANIASGLGAAFGSGNIGASSVQSAPATAPPQAKKSDPFADLGNLLGGNSGNSRAKQRTGASPNRAASPRPDPKNIMGSGYKLGGPGAQQVSRVRLCSEH